jgi:hypothetical protein
LSPSARTIVGAGIGVFSMVLFGEGVYHVAATGTCASGGPYQIARTCPPGTGWWIAVVAGSIIGLVVAAVVVEMGVALLVAGLFLAGGAGAIVALTDGSAAASGASLGLWTMMGVWALLGLGWLVATLSGRRKSRLAATLLERGTPAWAQLERVDDTAVTVNNNPRVRLTLRVRPEGKPEFEAHKTITVSRVAIPQVGATFPVWYDPDDHDKLALGLPDTAEGKEAIARARASGRAPEAADPLDRLKKLGELRDAGVLSQSEFEVQKVKILGGL